MADNNPDHAMPRSQGAPHETSRRSLGLSFTTTFLGLLVIEGWLGAVMDMFHHDELRQTYSDPQSALDYVVSLTRAGLYTIVFVMMFQRKSSCLRYLVALLGITVLILPLKYVFQPAWYETFGANGVLGCVLESILLGLLALYTRRLVNRGELRSTRSPP